MSDQKPNLQEDETPTMKKLRALVRSAGAGTLAFETVIPQAILTTLLVGGAVYLTVIGADVPDWLVVASGTIIGFYFGSDYEFRKLTGKVK